MRTIHNLNKWSFGVTAVLYCTIYFGLIAQIPLGAIQLILSFILLYKWKSMDIVTRKHLVTYFILVMLYFPLFLSGIANTLFEIIYVMILPMFIAGYFVFITSLAKKSLGSGNQSLSTINKI